MRKHILVVDDEREIAEYIGELVMRMFPACFVEIYSSGTKALQSIEQRYFDLVITDIVMPKTGGFAILNYIADHAPRTEVIFLTAYKDFDYIYQANKIKHISYIVKTEDDETICGIIRDVMHRIDKHPDPPAKDTADLEENAEVLHKEAQESELTVRIKAYISNQIGREISIDMIAQKLHYSPAYLSRIFKEHTGSNLSAYIKEYKLSTAKRLLRETDMSVQSIAMNLGYQTSQAFARAFKRETGMSPQQYRRNI